MNREAAELWSDVLGAAGRVPPHAAVLLTIGACL
jgi:hypothetical protein